MNETTVLHFMKSSGSEMRKKLVLKLCHLGNLEKLKEIVELFQLSRSLGFYFLLENGASHKES